MVIVPWVVGYMIESAKLKLSKIVSHNAHRPRNGIWCPAGNNLTRSRMDGRVTRGRVANRLRVGSGERSQRGAQQGEDRETHCEQVSTVRTDGSKRMKGKRRIGFTKE